RRFYPKNIFDKNDELDALKQKWYAGHLSAMNEDPIYDTDSSDLTIYRFLYLRTFNNPIMIEVAVKKNENNLKAVILSGAGGYEPGTIEKEINKALNEKEIQEIEKYIEKMDFWNLKTNDGQLGLDGSQCIFEVHDKSNKYHIIDRWSPEYYSEDNKYYIELINYLLNLADINIPEVQATGGKVKNIAKKLDERFSGAAESTSKN
nr:hypothetical protein [Candidatus Sigynarchaeota archaeon]